jgi:hypothetical protein
MAEGEGLAPVVAAVEPTATPELSIEEREAAISVRENTLAAKAEFAKAGIPESLLEFVVNPDSEKQTASIAKLSKSWQSAIKEALKTRLAGEAPVAPSTSVKDFNSMTYAERLALKRSDPATYASLRARP